MINLGAMIGFGSSFATDINNAGHVVGTVMTENERMSFVWRDGKMVVHRGGKGLHLTNSISDAELVIGASYDRKLSAATMVSNAVAIATPRAEKLQYFIALVLIVGTLTLRPDGMFGKKVVTRV